jgi:hypothetical protein
MSAFLKGRALIHPEEIDDDEAFAESLRALMFGGDEDEERSTQSRSNWNYHPPPSYTSPFTNLNFQAGGTTRMSTFEWIRDLDDLDNIISEEVAVPPTPLPTSNILEKIDDMTDKLGSWFSVAMPHYHKRLFRYAFDEMAEIGSMLRTGQINASEAEQRFDTVMAGVGELVEFSRYED